MLLFEFGLFEGKGRIMKLEFKYDDVWYKIHFNGRSVIELRGDKLDIMELCCNLECRKEFGSTEDYASEKVKRTCVVSAFQTSDMYMKKFIYQAFRSEELYDSHDLFVVENAKAFINDEMIEIIKAHPNHYWLLCGFELPYSLIPSDAICEMRSDDTGRFFWNVFTPEEPPTYRDFKFHRFDKDFHLNMGNHNVVLIRGAAASGKSMMHEELRALSQYVWSTKVWNQGCDGYLLGSEESMYAEVCAFGYKDSQMMVDLLKVGKLFDEYKTFVIDNADVIVDSEFEEVIKAHPEHNWILIGNRKPNFVPDDAVSVWKNEGHRYWNEFTSENNSTEV